jgi:hypothetical protein
VDPEKNPRADHVFDAQGHDENERDDNANVWMKIMD